MPVRWSRARCFSSTCGIITLILKRMSSTSTSRDSGPKSTRGSMSLCSTPFAERDTWSVLALIDRLAGYARTTAFRLVAVYVALFVVVAAIITGVLFWQTNELVTHQ